MESFLWAFLDDGTVVGVPEKAAPDMVKNFIKVVSNPVLFSPTTYLIPEIIKYDENHHIRIESYSAFSDICFFQ